jgi:methylmalonyl-CoA/ethylmalonyl-CoA epimerase
MKILGIEHIGIAVNDLDTSAPFWSHILNISHKGKEIVQDQGVLTDIYDTTQGKVELLQSLGDDTPIGKFLSKRGPGVHHVCFEVDDINQAINELNELNIHILSDHPTRGAEVIKLSLYILKVRVVY